MLSLCSLSTKVWSQAQKNLNCFLLALLLQMKYFYCRWLWPPIISGRHRILGVYAQWYWKKKHLRCPCGRWHRKINVNVTHKTVNLPYRHYSNDHSQILRHDQNLKNTEGSTVRVILNKNDTIVMSGDFLWVDLVTGCSDHYVVVIRCLIFFPFSVSVTIGALNDTNISRNHLHVLLFYLGNHLD